MTVKGLINTGIWVLIGTLVIWIIDLVLGFYYFQDQTVVYFVPLAIGVIYILLKSDKHWGNDCDCDDYCD